MASKIKLSNQNGVTLTLENNDNALTDKVVAYFDTVEELTGYVGTDGDVLHVSDKDRGGIFIYDSTATDNGGTIFGKCVRQYSGAVNVRWFGAVGDNTADDTDAIQNTVYNVGHLGSNAGDVTKSIFIPAGKYKITKPILFYALDGLHIYGESRMSTQIKPSGAMIPVLDADFQGLQDAAVYDYSSYRSCFIFSAARRTGKGDWDTVVENTAQWHIQIENMAFIGEYESRNTLQGIASPRLANTTLHGLFFKYIKDGLVGTDFYRMTISYCDFTSMGGLPILHEANNALGATGTSVTIQNCGSYETNGGFKLYKLYYSSMINCAVDNWVFEQTENGTIQTYAYEFHSCNGMSVISCGAEDNWPTITKGLFNVTGGTTSSVSFIQGTYIIKDTASATELDLCTFDAEYVSINGSLIKLSNEGFKATRIEVLSGTVKVDNLVNSESPTNLFKITGTGVKIEAGAKKLHIVTKNDVVQPSAVSTYLTVNLGANSGLNHWYAYSDTAITIPYDGMFNINILVGLSGLGGKYISARINGTQGFGLVSLNPNDVKQSYSFSQSKNLVKGDTVGILLRSLLADSTIQIDHVYFSITSEV